MDQPDFDAVLVVAFGGPERSEDVMPFLENVTRGRRVPRDRLLEVAEHYEHFGGKSPLNDQVRAVIDKLGPELASRGLDLPIFWGNRNWHPFLPEALREMESAGIRRALALVLAGYSSYSSCRQYQDNIAAAQSEVPGAPPVEKIRVFYNHPEFIAVNAENVTRAIETLPATLRGEVHLAFTAHSIPQPMADACDYQRQLEETSRLVAEAVGVPEDRWKLVFQSRSGRPSDPWLEPDILDHLESLKHQAAQSVTIVPIGFLSDHLEVLFDLDCEARDKALELDLPMARAETVGDNPRFVAMLAELIEERITDREPRAIGRFSPAPMSCAVGCCPPR